VALCSVARSQRVDGDGDGLDEQDVLARRDVDTLGVPRSEPLGDRQGILILTTFDLDEYVYEALRAGASGFVLKDDPPDQLLAASRS